MFSQDICFLGNLLIHLIDFNSFMQNPANKREILCDENLKALFNGKDSVGFLEVASLLTHHFVKKG